MNAQSKPDGFFVFWGSGLSRWNQQQICPLIPSLLFVCDVKSELCNVAEMRCKSCFRVYFSFKGAAWCWHQVRDWVPVAACNTVFSTDTFKGKVASVESPVIFWVRCTKAAAIKCGRCRTVGLLVCVLSVASRCRIEIMHSGRQSCSTM